MEDICEQVYQRRRNGEDFSDIAHSLELSNKEARQMYNRAKYKRNRKVLTDDKSIPVEQAPQSI